MSCSVPSCNMVHSKLTPQGPAKAERDDACVVPLGWSRLRPSQISCHWATRPPSALSRCGSRYPALHNSRDCAILCGFDTRWMNLTPTPDLVPMPTQKKRFHNNICETASGNAADSALHAEQLIEVCSRNSNRSPTWANSSLGVQSRTRPESSELSIHLSLCVYVMDRIGAVCACMTHPCVGTHRTIQAQYVSHEPFQKPAMTDFAATVFKNGVAMTPWSQSLHVSSMIGPWGC